MSRASMNPYPIRFGVAAFREGMTISSCATVRFPYPTTLCHVLVDVPLTVATGLLLLIYSYLVETANPRSGFR